MAEERLTEQEWRDRFSAPATTAPEAVTTSGYQAEDPNVNRRLQDEQEENTLPATVAPDAVTASSYAAEDPDVNRRLEGEQRDAEVRELVKEALAESRRAK